MALALDGTPGHSNATTNSATVNISTTVTNTFVGIYVTSNGGPVTGVTSSGLTWAARTALASGSNYLEFWWAAAASILTTHTVTVALTSSAYTTLDVFAVSGANTSSPFDGAAVTDNTNPANPLSISTTNPNTFIVAGWLLAASDAIAGSGFTLIGPGSDFQAVEYKIVSTTQAGLSADVVVSSTQQGIAQAIVAADAAGVGFIDYSIHADVPWQSKLVGY